MTDVGGIAGDTLRSYIERIERLEAEKTALAADIREIFSEAKGNGFDAKIMRQIVRLRRMDREDRLEQEELLAIYQHAMGWMRQSKHSALQQIFNSTIAEYKSIPWPLVNKVIPCNRELFDEPIKKPSLTAKEKLRPISGFPELLPEERRVELNWIDQIRTIFESYGFTSIEPRTVEPIDVLLKQGDTDKEIYTLGRLLDTPKSDREPTFGLHYDLTIPMARYVAANMEKLDFPFKRYQIQKAWRGERPQDGL